jgi:lysophospholipase L1-like esterase
MEFLQRGLIAVTTEKGIFLSWRLLGNEPSNTAFHIYRDDDRLTEEPIDAGTNYVDPDGVSSSTYSIQAVVGREEQQPCAPVRVWDAAYLSVPLQRPQGGTTPDGVEYVYHANDASVGDLDGDGEYEIVLKWDPSNSHDNAHVGFTGNVYLDAYKLDGRRLWRIDLGVNIRAGAHYTQLMVYDLDGDGRAEVACKTADGTVDGTGQVIGDPTADYRNPRGFIIAGPEFLTVFDGETGGALVTTDYDPPRGDVGAWGDTEGNRVDRFLACIAYLDGVRPSLVMCRGYYTRTVLAAYNYRDGVLSKLWTFDSDQPGNQGYAGQGNHSLAVADVDGDGMDEIVYGACVIDHDGSGLYTTGLRHGDAMHVGNLDPSRPGLEVYQVHETPSSQGIEVHDAGTGEVLWSLPTSTDIGRGLAADIDPRYEGVEVWASDDWRSGGFGLYNVSGHKISDRNPQSFNFAIWWDGDLLRELLDHDFDPETGVGVGRIDKWDYENERLINLLTPYGTRSNNWTKGNPCLQADLFGDWREEVIWRSEDSSELRIYSTTDPTEHRIPTLMHDPVYRLSVAWQNVAYNQPPHPGFFLGHGMETPPKPDIYTVRKTRKRIYLAGDSTVQPYRPELPEQSGWGQYLADFLEADVEVINHAIGGRSSRTFVEEGRLEQLVYQLNAGDYLFIQMGHNDASANKPERYTDPHTDFKRYLGMYLDGARFKGATPVLFTPVGTLRWEDGRFINDFPEYCQAVLELAARENVAVIDLMSLSLNYLDSIGYEKARRMYMVSENGTDHVHFTHDGARRIAVLVAQGISALNGELQSCVRFR